MNIAPGSLVSLNVKLYDAQGRLLESSGAPLVYLHGAGDIFAGIERALEGQSTGFRSSVWLEPEDAFGDDDPSLLHLVPVAALGDAVELDMRFEGLPGKPPDGRIYRVIDLADEVAVLDGNHPLAGQALRFDIEVAGVEAASEDMRAAAERPQVPEFLGVGEHGIGSTRH